MSMQVDVAISSATEIGRAVESLRWIGVLRVVGAALVALGVGLELIGEVLGHPPEQTLRAARETEIAGLTAQIEELRRIAPKASASCGNTPASVASQDSIQACPVPED